MKRLGTWAVALFFLASATTVNALQCVEMPSSIDTPLPGVGKNMRKFTEQSERDQQNDRLMLSFCATTVRMLVGTMGSYTMCGCHEAIRSNCKVTWDNGVPEMKGPAECAVFLSAMI